MLRSRPHNLKRSPAVCGPRLETLEPREVPAAVGALDPSFGTGGTVTTTFGNAETAAAVAVQPDGRIVVAGTTAASDDFAIARYNPDGSLDTTFGGGDGKFSFTFGGVEAAHGLALQADGRIVVVGTTDQGGGTANNIAIARVLADGSGLDPTFSGDGKLTVEVAGDDDGRAVAIRPDGRIVVVGTNHISSSPDFSVVQVNADGTLDATFSGDGKLDFTFGGNEFARAVALQPDGRVVVAGFSDQGGGTADNFVIARVLADGSGLDPTFSGDGKLLIDFGDDDEASGVAIQPDGKIVVVGTDIDASPDFIVTRLNPDGTFDPTFSGDGKLVQTLGGNDQARAVALTPTGKIVVAGFSDQGGAPADNFAVLRLNPDGTADNAFDGDGRAFVQFGADDEGAAVAIDANGRVVVAGSSAGDFAVARLIGSVEEGRRLAVGGSTDGRAQVFSPDFATGQYGNMPASTPTTVFPGFAGAVRTAVGDVNGDGVPDVAVMTGPGTPIRFAVLSGVDNATPLVAPMAPFAGSEDFAGGGFVAVGDLDNDGRAEVVVTPDQGGGPRVTIFSLRPDNTVAVRANFLGIDDPDFRGGARAALGDVNGDGVQDLAVAAGFLGGPRVALFDGKTVFGTPTRLVGDFFAFPGEDATRLRNGAYVAAGDVDGDGKADLIFGGGPGGAPRVFVLGGALVAANNVAGAQAAPVANFFVAGNSTDRGGVRVAAADADGDNRAEVVAGSGEGVASRARVYLGRNFTTASEPATFQDLDPYAGAVLAGGVFVG